jgi:hypothetical protein
MQTIDDKIAALQREKMEKRLEVIAADLKFSNMYRKSYIFKTIHKSIILAIEAKQKE